MRPRVIWAVAWRDLRRVVSGRKRYSLPLLAALLLLPVGAMPLPSADTPTGPPPLPIIQGEIPPQLREVLRSDPSAASTLSPGPPVVLHAPFVTPRMRSALDSLDEAPPLVVRNHRTPLQLPGRSLLVALIAISLLTGPLAESLPGEREEGTFETLLAAALSRGELVAGKWLAWTLAASTAAILSSLSGMLTGAQSPGAWLIGVPLALSVAVAGGLWLVRSASDVVGGAAAPMRVIPSAAVLALGLAWLAAQYHPLLGAAFPLGGPLLLASGLLSGVLPILVCLASTAAVVAVLLRATARDLQRPPGRAEAATWGLILGAAVCFWLPVAAPAAWSLAGRGELVDPAAGIRAAGVLATLLATTTFARDVRAPRWRRPSGIGLLLAIAAGLGLSLLDNLSLSLPVSGPLAERLLTRPSDLTGALALAIGGELLFRGILTRRLGSVGALVAWVVLVHPLDPLVGLASGIALGYVARNHGITMSIVGALLWLMM
jgi:hypothetical protein